MDLKRNTWGKGTRFALLTLVTGALVAAVAGQAAAQVLAPDDMARVIPKSTIVSTPIGVQADGLRWNATAAAYSSQQDRQASSYYTPQALEAQGLRMQAMAQAYDNHQTGSTGSSSSSGGFDWRDGLIGVAGGIGLAFGAAGLALVAVRMRREHVPV